MNNQEIHTHVLIDSRAMGIALMDQDSARHHPISLHTSKENKEIEVIDGRPIESGDIAQIGKVGMRLQNHKQQLPKFISKLGHRRIVLGISGL